MQSTSATTPIQPAITAALAWAPLIPPRPAVTKTWCKNKKKNKHKYDNYHYKIKSLYIDLQSHVKIDEKINKAV